MAMLALGELNRLGDVIDLASDHTGLLLDLGSLPKRPGRPRRGRKGRGA